MASHFRFTSKQRNGMLFLVVLIVILQLAHYTLGIRRNTPEIDEVELELWRAEVDSLAGLNSDSQVVSIYPFNPNFITDFKGYTLGMSIDQIDALHKYRANDQWINSKEEFKEVTGVTQQWLDSISPYFKFPEWVNNSEKRVSDNRLERPKSFSEKIDLNLANANQLQTVRGIGPALSKRIIEYRDRFDGGFADDIELIEIYGLDQEVIMRISEEFTVKSARPIDKININQATSDELVTIPYIDYEIAFRIIEYRTLHEGISNIEELTKIDDFPENKIKLIGLYLQF